MTAAAPADAPLPRGMYVLAFLYFTVAAAALTFAVQQGAASRRETALVPLAGRGDDLPQGKTVMANGDVYVREGNLVTHTPAGAQRSTGWYVGDDPRAAGGAVGRSGRVSIEYCIGVAIAVAGCGAIGACCLVRAPWAWRFVYACQMLVGVFGGVCALFWLVVLCWLASLGGQAGTIGLMIAPAAVATELAVVGLALFGLWYLQRAHVRAAYGIVEAKSAFSLPPA